MEMRPFVTLRKKKERKSRRRLLVIRVRLIIRQRRPVIYFRGFVKHGGLLLSSKWELFGVFLFSGQFIFSISSQFFKTHKKKKFWMRSSERQVTRFPFTLLKITRPLPNFYRFPITTSFLQWDSPLVRLLLPLLLLFLNILYILSHSTCVSSTKIGGALVATLAAFKQPIRYHQMQKFPNTHTHTGKTHTDTRKRRRRRRKQKNERECPIWFRSSPLRPISPSYFLSYRLRRRRRRRKKNKPVKQGNDPTSRYGNHV